MPFAARRRGMVEVQLRRRGIRDGRVLEAMYAIPRHEFVPPEFVDSAYDDKPLPIGISETISQPYIVAAMSEAAQIRPGDKVLEVGAGSGYQAAILSHLGARVTAIERNPELAMEARERLRRLGYANVEVVVGDGSEGFPQESPFQAIVVTAAAPSLPEQLLDQLDDGGRMVIPVGDRRRQELLLILKCGGETATRELGPCQFVPLIGKAAWPEKNSDV